MEVENVYEKEFIPQVKKWGPLLLIIGMPLTFIPAIYVWWAYNIIPSGSQIMAGFGLAVAVLWAVYIVEPISYYPILGMPGVYMMCLAGNISNLRLPCAAVAQETAGVTFGTKEGSIIATLAMSTSMLVSTIIIFLGALGAAVVLNHLPPFVLHAFNYILPAIFGAIFGQFLIKGYLIGIIALALGLFFNYYKVLPDWAVLLVCVFGTILISRILWERGMLGKKSEN
ncbi:MAG: Uncharacterized protein XD85_0113 [Parcubacteria bacterium 34_609]|nr:MAG: Uncharacterized protein XD85_0113 [Parcubacteria bacterium 34_609]